ncbi:MAG: DUF4886 domain-containing protein, partial [Verrucomicrobiota bacterium]
MISRNFALVLAVFAAVNVVSAQEKTRVLFIGNSYTGGIRGTLTSFIKAAPEGSSVEMEFITPGGKTLEFHLNTPATTQKIADGNWDFVVLQDQSQTPAVFPDKFAEAAKGLDKLIDQAGAQTVFYQTWGRRDGDKMNRQMLPTYEVMQKKLSDNYASAAKRNDATLAPVGDTWAKVRKADAKLGAELYKGDGSHPSGKGAYLAACVFYATIFGKSPAAVDFQGGVSEAEAKTILDAVNETLDLKIAAPPSPYPVNRTITNAQGKEIANFNLNFHKKGLTASEYLTNAFDQSLPYHDSLDQYFGQYSNITIFVYNSGAYENLKSRGLDIIENDTLR